MKDLLGLTIAIFQVDPAVVVQILRYFAPLTHILLDMDRKFRLLIADGAQNDVTHYVCGSR